MGRAVKPFAIVYAKKMKHLYPSAVYSLSYFLLHIKLAFRHCLTIYIKDICWLISKLWKIFWLPHMPNVHFWATSYCILHKIICGQKCKIVKHCYNDSLNPLQYIHCKIYWLPRASTLVID